MTARMHEKLLPFSLDAERGVLGSLIIDPEAMVHIADRLQPDDFYRDAHHMLFQMILSLYQEQNPADFITLCDALEKGGKLETVGGASYITSLINHVPTSGNVVYYALIVAQKALFRRLIHLAGQIAASAYDEESDALEQAEQRLFALDRKQRQTDFASIDTVLSACLDSLDQLHTQRGTIIGVPTGFACLDVPLGGLQSSDLLILAARPGTGKTSFALNIACNAAYQHQKRVAFFSLEMSKQQLGFRLLAMQSRVDQQRLRLGWVHENEWEAIIGAMDTLSEGIIWIDDTAGVSLTEMRSKARRLLLQQGIDLIIVDYLQLMQAKLEGKRYVNREQEIAEISRGLKGIAKELNVPVLALAQLSRAVENRQSKVPQLSDLRESGAIENDADVVLFIYREEMYDPDSVEKHTADIIIAKHRNGPVGSVRLGFEATQTRFYAIDQMDAENG